VTGVAIARQATKGWVGLRGDRVMESLVVARGAENVGSGLLMQKSGNSDKERYVAVVPDGLIWEELGPGNAYRRLRLASIA
jgi:hypothetical protein